MWGQGIIFSFHCSSTLSYGAVCGKHFYGSFILFGQGTMQEYIHQCFPSGRMEAMLLFRGTVLHQGEG